MNGWSSMFDAVPSEHPLDPSSSRTQNGVHVPRPIHQTQSRPSLSRLTDVLEKEVADAAASQRGNPLADGGREADIKGKGRAVDMIEVIVHKVSLRQIAPRQHTIILAHFADRYPSDHTNGFSHGGSTKIWNRGPSCLASLRFEMRH